MTHLSTSPAHQHTCNYHRSPQGRSYVVSKNSDGTMTYTPYTPGSRVGYGQTRITASPGFFESKQPGQVYQRNVSSRGVTLEPFHGDPKGKNNLYTFNRNPNTGVVTLTPLEDKSPRQPAERNPASSPRDEPSSSRRDSSSSTVHRQQPQRPPAAETEVQPQRDPRVLQERVNTGRAFGQPYVPFKENTQAGDPHSRNGEVRQGVVYEARQSQNGNGELELVPTGYIPGFSYDPSQGLPPNVPVHPDSPVQEGQSYFGYDQAGEGFSNGHSGQPANSIELLALDPKFKPQNGYPPVYAGRAKGDATYLSPKGGAAPSMELKAGQEYEVSRDGDRIRFTPAGAKNIDENYQSAGTVSLSREQLGEGIYNHLSQQIDQQGNGKPPMVVPTHFDSDGQGGPDTLALQIPGANGQSFLSKIQDHRQQESVEDNTARSGQQPRKQGATAQTQNQDNRTVSRQDVDIEQQRTDTQRVFGKEPYVAFTEDMQASNPHARNGEVRQGVVYEARQTQNSNGESALELVPTGYVPGTGYDPSQGLPPTVPVAPDSPIKEGESYVGYDQDRKAFSNGYNGKPANSIELLALDSEFKPRDGYSVVYDSEATLLSPKGGAKPNNELKANQAYTVTQEGEHLKFTPAGPKRIDENYQPPGTVVLSKEQLGESIYNHLSQQVNQQSEGQPVVVVPTHFDSDGQGGPDTLALPVPGANGQNFLSKIQDHRQAESPEDSTTRSEHQPRRQSATSQTDTSDDNRTVSRQDVDIEQQRLDTQRAFGKEPYVAFKEDMQAGNPHSRNGEVREGVVYEARQSQNGDGTLELVPTGYVPGYAYNPADGMPPSVPVAPGSAVMEGQSYFGHDQEGKVFSNGRNGSAANSVELVALDSTFKPQDGYSPVYAGSGPGDITYVSPKGGPNDGTPPNPELRASQQYQVTQEGEQLKFTPVGVKRLDENYQPPSEVSLSREQLGEDIYKQLSQQIANQDNNQQGVVVAPVDIDIDGKNGPDALALRIPDANGQIFFSVIQDYRQVPEANPEADTSVESETGTNVEPETTSNIDQVKAQLESANNKTGRFSNGGTLFTPNGENAIDLSALNDEERMALGIPALQESQTETDYTVSMQGDKYVFTPAESTDKPGLDAVKARLEEVSGQEGSFSDDGQIFTPGGNTPIDFSMLDNTQREDLGIPLLEDIQPNTRYSVSMDGDKFAFIPVEETAEDSEVII